MNKKLIKFNRVKGQWSMVNGQEGFTLVETLIYVAIIGAAASAFISFMITILESRNKTYVIEEVQANSRMAIDVIAGKIQSATGINIASSTFNLDPGVLSLSMASTTLNPTVFSLNQDDGILTIKEGDLATTSITSNTVQITNLVFYNLTSSSTRENVRMELTVDYNNKSSNINYDYSQSLRTAASVRQ